MTDGDICDLIRRVTDDAGPSNPNWQTKVWDRIEVDDRKQRVWWRRALRWIRQRLQRR